jgi:exosortase A
MNAPLAYPLLAAPTAAWRRSLPPLAFLLVAVGALYYDSFRAMVQIWQRSDTFAHAFIVPPIALWLIWRQREVLSQHAPRPTSWLLLPLAGVGLAWLLGRMVAVNSVMQLSVTAMLVLAVPLVLGHRIALLILFPLNYLFFAVPIGEFLMPQLMQSTADFTVAALRLSGIPVYREGLQFVIPSGNWSVVEACSGVRYLMASFMVGSLFAYLNYRSWWRRLVFGIVSLLVPVVANWLRAYMIVMLGHLSGNKLAVGVDHLIYGWVFFGVVITVVFIIGARWAEAPAAAELPRATDVAMPDNSAARSWALAILGALLLALPPLALQRIDASERVTSPRLSLPQNLAAGWQRDAAAADLWKPAFQNPSSEWVARYAATNGQAVGVYLAYYSGQNDERKLVSSENVLVPTKDPVWNPVESGTHELQMNEGGVTFRQTRLLRTGASSMTERDQMLVWQLYWVDGRLMHHDMQAKLAGALQRLRGQGDASAAVVLYAVEEPGKPAAQALKDFANANLSMIEAALRAARDAR